MPHLFCSPYTWRWNCQWGEKNSSGQSDRA